MKVVKNLVLCVFAVAIGSLGWSGLTSDAMSGVVTANGWYKGEEIYYIDHGFENVPHQAHTQIYLIGNNRLYQANVVQTVPGQPGYTPHWRVNVVHTADGVTLQDILASDYASEHFTSDGVLFDDSEDILNAAMAGLVVIDRPLGPDGTPVVVLCPVISETGAEAPGNEELPEDFEPFPETF
jgi:hypothetical protein